MCDEITEKENDEYLKGVSRRRFNTLTAGAALAIMLPRVANALDVEMFEAVMSALATAEEEGSRALVITGSGSIFSAGVDLRRVLREDLGLQQPRAGRHQVLTHKQARRSP